MKGHCVSCVFFQGIKNIIGYCNVLGIMMEDDVVILDTIDTLKLIKNSENEKLFEPVIVQAYFGCPLYEDKNAKLQLQ